MIQNSFISAAFESETPVFIPPIHLFHSLSFLKFHLLLNQFLVFSKFFFFNFILFLNFTKLY